MKISECYEWRDSVYCSIHGEKYEEGKEYKINGEYYCESCAEAIMSVFGDKEIDKKELK